LNIASSSSISNIVSLTGCRPEQAALNAILPPGAGLNTNQRLMQSQPRFSKGIFRHFQAGFYQLKTPPQY